MKNTDLRIGNILAFVLPDSYCQVDYIERELIGSSPLGKGSEAFNAERSIDDFKPVSITESWMVKFGFELFPWGYVKNNVLIGYSFNGHGTPKFYLEVGNGLRVDLQYIHQLQNLYIALIGEELLIH